MQRGMKKKYNLIFISTQLSEMHGRLKVKSVFKETKTFSTRTIYSEQVTHIFRVCKKNPSQHFSSWGRLS